MPFYPSCHSERQQRNSHFMSFWGSAPFLSFWGNAMTEESPPLCYERSFGTSYLEDDLVMLRDPSFHSGWRKKDVQDDSVLSFWALAKNLLSYGMRSFVSLGMTIRMRSFGTSCLEGDIFYCHSSLCAERQSDKESYLCFSAIFNLKMPDLANFVCSKHDSYGWKRRLLAASFYSRGGGDDYLSPGINLKLLMVYEHFSLTSANKKKRRTGDVLLHNCHALSENIERDQASSN